MRLNARRTRGVGHEIYIVSFIKRMDNRECKAHLGPQSRKHDLLAAGVLHPPNAALVLPRIDEGPVNRRLLREYVLNLLENVAAAILDDRRKERWDLECLRCLRESDRIVDHQSNINVLYRRRLKGLMIDQHQGAIAWCQHR